MYQVVCPIYLPQTKKKSFALNLNIYRNAHFLVLNKMKVLFKECIQDQIAFLPTMGGVKLTYTLFMGSNREMDLSNVCVIVDKFFCDALVEAGKLEDDNFKFLNSIEYRFGGIEPGKPRCEVTLEPTSIIEENKPMRISLVQSEIEEALKAYISEQMTIADGMEFKISLAATRGADGYTAEIDITKKVESVTTLKKTRGPRAANTQVETNTDGVTATDVALSEDNEDASAYAETSVVVEDQEQREEAPDEAVPAFVKEGRKSIFANS